MPVALTAGQRRRLLLSAGSSPPSLPAGLRTHIMSGVRLVDLGHPGVDLEGVVTLQRLVQHVTQRLLGTHVSDGSQSLPRPPPGPAHGHIHNAGSRTRGHLSFY